MAHKTFKQKCSTHFKIDIKVHRLSKKHDSFIYGKLLLQWVYIKNVFTKLNVINIWEYSV